MPTVCLISEQYMMAGRGWGPGGEGGRGRGWGAGEGLRHLIPKDSEALLECELEPVPAGDSVSSPVVKVLMAHHAFNACKVHVGCSLRGGQHQAAVEDVQRLVLHGTHVEVVHSHNVEQVQVVLQPKGILHKQPLVYSPQGFSSLNHLTIMLCSTVKR